MTKKQKSDYLKSGFAHCPYCKSNNISGDGIDIESDYAIQEVTCYDCGRSWRDHYKLVDVEPMIVLPTP